MNRASSSMRRPANLVQECRTAHVPHFIYTSSSSVYGANERSLFSIDDAVNHPISLYAATKRVDELIAYAYNHLFSLSTTGLRFFRVYGPWGTGQTLLNSLSSSTAAFRIYNIGHGSPVRVGECVDLVEACPGKKAIRVSAPIQPGDVVSTHPDTQSLRHGVGFSPSIPIDVGIPRFVKWYMDYYGKRQ